MTTNDCEARWKPIEGVSHEMLLLVIQINDGFMDTFPRGDFSIYDVITWATQIFGPDAMRRLIDEAGGCRSCAFRRVREWIIAQEAADLGWVERNFPELLLEHLEEIQPGETIH